MTRALAQLNRFFVTADFSISYRRAKQLQWQNQATLGYSLLAVLQGELSYTTGGKSIELHAPQFVFFEPNFSITADAPRAELLFVV